MLPENITAIVARNEKWSGEVASEPYETGWAREAIVFVRLLKEPEGPPPEAWIEISPDGMHWVREGTAIDMPVEKDRLAFCRIQRFGNWIRLAARYADGAHGTVLVTLHLKA